MMKKPKAYLVAVFMLVAGIQLAVPARMILNREKILREGRPFKFQSAPLDPSDPFRGKYITLDFKENPVYIPENADFEMGQTIYVRFREDPQGLVRVTGISRDKPGPDLLFVKAKAGYTSTGHHRPKLFIDYPFDRFYMEESKAYAAEELYQDVRRDSTRLTYALVKVLDGEPVLQDVLIDGVPIREVVKAGRARQEKPE